MGTRRSQTDPGAWDVLVRVRNYGLRPHVVNVTLNFGNAPRGAHPIDLPPGAEKETSFSVHTEAAGLLEARLYPRDAFAADNYAALELPSQRSLHVIVYSDQPEALRPALASDPRVKADFRPTRSYTPADDGLVILDQLSRPEKPVLRAHRSEIDPSNDRPVVPIRERVQHPEGLRWIPDLPLTQGLRARNSQIEAASVFEAGPGDTRIAEIDKGPVMIARGNMAVIGFNPFAGSMRYELATPLLLGNILRWAAPDVFRDVDVGISKARARFPRPSLPTSIENPFR